MKRHTLMVAGVLVAASLASPVGAAERQTLLIEGTTNPDAKVIGEFLFPEAQCENAKYQCMAVRPSAERSVGLEVRFPTNSAELTSTARAQLEALGKALASRNGKLAPGEIVIEGHADARGSAELNKRLSEQRARSVMDYLVTTFKVDASALKPLGRGKENLKQGSRPDSEVNRRVELVRRAN